MKGTHLGEFEEIVLLSIAALQQEAYGLAIKRDLEAQTGRSISLSAVHAACNRMETKGYLGASFGEATKKRGGKRKKIYRVTAAGHRAMTEAHALRTRMWQRLPLTTFQLRLT